MFRAGLLISNGQAMVSGMPKPVFACRLPIEFDAKRLAQDLLAVPDDSWVAHFNKGFHDGGWSGVALRATAGEARQLYPGHGDQTELQDTPLLAHCPQIAVALTRLACSIGSVRLLRLAAGGSIREHRDADLCLEQSLARLHVPITTGDKVEFYLEEQLITMGPGECWYLNFDLPHRVQNLGSTDRVHLVIDCEVNEWLRDQIIRATPLVATERETSQWRFEQFREAVINDVVLIEHLWPIDQPAAFIDRVVALGQERGLRFTPEDVATVMRQGGRAGLRYVQ